MKIHPTQFLKDYVLASLPRCAVDLAALHFSKVAALKNEPLQKQFSYEHPNPFCDGPLEKLLRTHFELTQTLKNEQGKARLAGYHFTLQNLMKYLMALFADVRHLFQDTDSPSPTSFHGPPCLPPIWTPPPEGGLEGFSAHGPAQWGQGKKKTHPSFKVSCYFMLLQNPWVVQLQMPRLEKQSTRRPCLTEWPGIAGSASSPWHSRSWRRKQKGRPRASQSNAQREAKKCRWPPWYKLLKSQRSSGHMNMFGHCLPPCFNHRGALHLELLDPKATTSVQRNDHGYVSPSQRVCISSKTRTVDRKPPYLLLQRGRFEEFSKESATHDKTAASKEKRNQKCNITGQNATNTY